MSVSFVEYFISDLWFYYSLSIGDKEEIINYQLIEISSS